MASAIVGGTGVVGCGTAGTRGGTAAGCGTGGAKGSRKALGGAIGEAGGAIGGGVVGGGAKEGGLPSVKLQVFNLALSTVTVPPPRSYSTAINHEDRLFPGF
jgi:hypothetical protein